MKQTVSTVFDDLEIGITLHDPETGAIVEVNSRLEELYGYSKSELREMEVADYSADSGAFTQADAEKRIQAAAEGEPQSFEWQVKRSDDQLVWVSVRLAETTLDGDRYVIAEIRDITERKEREQELAIKNQAIEQAPVGVTMTDPSQEDNPLVYANKAFTDLIGYSQSEITGWNHRTLQGDDTSQDAIDEFRTAIDNGESTMVELRNYRKDGTMFWSNVSLAPLHDDSGSVTNWVGFQENVTKRKKREQELAELHTATRKLMGATTSQEAADIACQTAEDVLGFSINSINFYDETKDGLAPVAVSDAVRELLDSPPVLNSGLAWEAFQQHNTHIKNTFDEADDLYNPETEIQSEMFVPFGEHGLLLVASTEENAFDETDLSLAKILTANIESTLDRTEQEQQYRQLTERISDAYYAVDTEFEFTYWNDVIADRIGISAEEILGQNLWDHFPEIKGTVVEERFREAMETQEPASCEYYYEKLDYWTQLQVYPDEDGLAVISKDITDRKEHEAQIERSNERLQEFAYILSHDLQEPLRMVSSYVDLLEMELDEHLDDETRKYMAFAVDGAERMRGMIDGLLQYSRVETNGEEFSETDVGTVVDGILEDLQLSTAEANAEVVVESLPTVQADYDQLGQLFQNLIKNAIEHGGEGTTVEVSVEKTVAGNQFAVSDDGPGIPADEQDDIFGLFDKGNDSDGTGIGLAVCERIVNRHNGSIWVESTPGEGTTFYFTLE